MLGRQNQHAKKGFGLQIIGRALAFYQSGASAMTVAVPRVCHLKTNICAIVTIRVARVVQLVFGRFVPRSFRSKYKKFFSSEPEICLKRLVLLSS